MDLQHPQPSSPWRSVPDAARELGVGPRTVYHAIKRGELRAAPVNARGDLRIHVDWIRQWLEHSAINAPERQVG
jgi:excisionase family DNA binding protein